MKSKAGNHALLLAGVQTGAMPKIELCGNRANRPRLFQRKFQFASDFLLGARYYAGLQKYKMASFHLHQAAENYLRTIPLVYILYGYKDHALEILMDRCKTHTLQLVSVFLEIRRRSGACSICYRMPMYKPATTRISSLPRPTSTP